MDVQLNFISNVSKLLDATGQVEASLTGMKDASAKSNATLQANAEKTAQSVGKLEVAINKTGTSLAANNSQINKTGTALGKLTVQSARAELAQKMLEQQLADTIGKGVIAAETFGENSEEAKVYHEEIFKLTESMAKLNSGVGDSEEGFKSLKQQFREAKLEAELLQKQANEGLIPQSVADDAVRRWSSIGDEIGDMKTKMDAFNPDRKLQAFSNVIRGLAGGFAAVQGAMGLLGSESEDVEKALLKVQSALAVSQGINSILEMKDGFKNLASVLGITTIAQKAHATSVVTSAGATQTATVTTRAFTAALLANPFVAVAALITAMGAALLYFGRQADQAKYSVEDLLKSLSSRNEEFTKFIGAKQDELKIQEEIDKLTTNKTDDVKKNYEIELDYLRQTQALRVKAQQETLEDYEKAQLQRQILNEEATKGTKEEIEATNATVKALGEKLEAQSVLVNRFENEKLLLKLKYDNYEVEAEKTKNQKIEDDYAKLQNELLDLRKAFLSNVAAIDFESFTEQQKVRFQYNQKLTELEDSFFALQKQRRVAGLQITPEEKSAFDRAIRELNEQFKAAMGGFKIELANPIEAKGNVDASLKEFQSVVLDAFPSFLERMNAQLKSAQEGTGFSIAEVLFPFNDDKQKAKIDASFKELGNDISEIYASFLNQRMQSVDQEIQLNNMRIESLTSNVDRVGQELDREMELYKAGYASNVSAKRKEIEGIKAERDKEVAHQQQLLAKKEKIAKQQAIIDGIATGSKLLLATAQAIQSAVSTGGIVGVVIGLAAAAALVSGFLGIKGEIKSATSMGDGGLLSHGLLRGDKHKPGVNASGMQIGNSNVWVEGGEYLNKASASTEYFGLLESINNNKLSGHGFKDLRKLLNESNVSLLDDVVPNAVSSKSKIDHYNILYTGSASHPGTEKKLDAINKSINELKATSKPESTTYLPDGTKVITRGNNKTIIRKG